MLVLSICSWILDVAHQGKEAEVLLVPLIIVPLSLFMCCCLFFTSLQLLLWIGQTVFGAYFHGFG